MTLLVVSIWLRRNGRPFVYTLVPMILVAAVTITAMLGEVRGYFATQAWLLAGSGTLILACDVWVLFEGLRVLIAVPGRTAGRANGGASSASPASRSSALQERR